MLSLDLAYLNLKRAGIRTWLNVIVLSISYVLIIWTQGLYQGMNDQASRAMIEEEIGGGQFWQKGYDPYDPLSIDDSHAALPSELDELMKQKKATPVLIRQAVVYPEGRIQPVLLKGIDPGQEILSIPSASLKSDEDILPVMIGARMAKNTQYSAGDYITIRWRDKNGTFDAIEGKVVMVMNTSVPTIDNGQLWIPLDELQKMTGLLGEATMVIVKEGAERLGDTKGFILKDHSFLLKDVHAMVMSKKVGASIMYAILMFLAMIAIFDTQTLSIFKRKREIGTLIALGMTRKDVIALFTIEGAMHGVLAFGLAAAYGIPLLIYTRLYGLKIPKVSEEFGVALSDRLFPAYGVGLVIGTVILIMLTVTIVSYLPTKKIAKLNPTNALRGKLK